MKRHLTAAMLAGTLFADDLPTTVTFAEHVAPIIFDACVECHRSGEAAPFSFTSYAAVRKRARTIQEVVNERYMPPWHPVPGHGEFKDNRRLSNHQLAILNRWIETGMAQGDPKQTPPVPTFPGGWRLGKPDLVVTMSEAYEVPADGPDIYRNFVIPLNLTEDKWVTGVEIRPSARTVVHHCLYFLDDSGEARKLDAKDDAPGFRKMGFRRSGSLGGWAVGGTPRLLEGDLAMPLPKGSDLVLSTHFHPSGKVEREKTTVAIYFADKKPTRVPLPLQIPPAYGRLAGIDIPPGEKDYRINGEFVAPIDMELITVSAHSHYLGKTKRLWAVLPDGTEQRLFYIDDWDFNWQSTYHYQEPVRIPKGTVLKGEVSFDNSADNPNNPFDPPRRAKWGIESTDEMGSVILTAVPVDAKDESVLKTAIRQNARGAAVAAGRRVVNGDGRLAEVIRQRLQALDRNGNGDIEASEMDFGKGAKRR